MQAWGAEVIDVSVLRMREATIAAGIWLTFGIGALGELYVAFTWSRPHRSELAVLFALAGVAALVVLALPRERIVRSRWREPFFLAWSALDFAMIVLGTLADGGTASPLVLVFFIPVVFSSMSYPLASVTAVGVFSVVSYLVLAVTTGGSSGEYEAAFAVALLCTAAMSAWQAQNHNRQHRALAIASRTDPLTGCLNRRGFEERAEAELAAMRRRGQRGAMVVLDIDQFKPVNDTFGHAVGDELLCWFVKTLELALRPSDAVGRLGGDEFAVILPDIAPDDARAAASELGEVLRERAPASLGLACFPNEGASLEELSRCADVRLYGSRRAHAARGAAVGAGESDRASVSVARSALAESIKPSDLWRAALEAMPGATRRAGASREDATLQGGLLDEIGASVVCTDMSGKVIVWNSGAEALYGWSAQEAIGSEARELIVPEDTTAAEQLFSEVSADGSWEGELLVRRKDRSLFTAYTRNRLIRDDDGQPVAIVGVAVDISTRVAAETELTQSRDYAQAVTECMGEGLFTTDLDGRVTYVNRAARSMLGWDQSSHDGLLGEAINTIRSDGSVRPFRECPIARALSRQLTVRVDEDLLQTKSGETLPVSYTASPYRTESDLEGCVVIFQDISERKRREEERGRDLATLACIDRVEEALADDRFVLHAQPIVDLRTGATVQHELLLRMVDVDGSVVAPGEFLPVAEQYSLIGEIDRWVIKQAAQLAGRGCPVEANISARSVGDPGVLEHIERCLQRSDVAPGMLVFEITETAIVEGEDAVRCFAERLHELGCRVALDDFGTGYGSLSDLKQVPVDILKLDIEFVRDLVSSSASRHVVQAVVALARDFGVQTVAEGVEDAATIELLARLGVDFAQGFHIARPEPFVDLPSERRRASGPPAAGSPRGDAELGSSVQPVTAGSSQP
jgi:diguanylate cyclase (GGDEF)-like protein/PAS domain S-box-containing protein